MANIKHCVIAGLHITIDTEDQELLSLLAPRYAVFEHREAAETPVVLALHDLSGEGARAMDGDSSACDLLQPTLTDGQLKADFDCQGAQCQFYQQGEEIEILMLEKEQVIARLRCDRTYADGRCWLSGRPHRREYCFNNFMMMLFAFVAIRHQTLLFHASVIGHAGRGYLFLAKSGTGKSTHSALWLKHIPGSELLNDDNPAVGLRDGQMMVYGTPWSGKTPCYRDVACPVGAMVNIQRDTTNHIEPLSPILAFTTHLSSCSGINWDKAIYRAQCDTITALVEHVPSYVMHCRPDREAAVTCSMGVGAWDGLDGDFSLNQESMRPNAVQV